MTRSAEEIEREVEATRAGLDDAIDALKSKMSPGQIIDELSQSLKGAGGGEMLGNLGAQVKDNPLAVAMIGAGVAWLMMGKGSGGHAQTQSEATPPFTVHHHHAGSSSVEGPQGEEDGVSRLGELKAKAADMAQGAATQAGEALSKAKDGAMGVAGQAKHGLESLGQGAASAGHKLQDRVSSSLDHEPLVIGALGLAVGLAIGAALPSTPLEDRTFGSARDKLLDEAKARASDGVEQVKDAAAAAYQGVSEAAEEEGLIGGEGGSIVEKAETVLRAGVDAAKHSVEEGRQSSPGQA